MLILEIVRKEHDLRLKRDQSIHMRVLEKGCGIISVCCLHLWNVVELLQNL